jgi:hypothetical protein
MLLSLLMKEEFLNKDLWAPNVDSAAVQAALHSMVMELRQFHNELFSAILKTGQASTSPNANKSLTCLLPMLKAYGGVSLEDSRVHDKLLQDIYALNKTDAKSSILLCKIRKNFMSSFVHVPSSKGFVQTKANAQRTKWIPHMLTVLGGQAVNKKEGLLDLLTYIRQKEDYKVTRVEAVRSNRPILPTLDCVTIRAIQSMSNMNKSQMSWLNVEMGLSSLQYIGLGLEQVEPQTGYYKYGNEKDWS